jgi:hypothetical protein
VTELLDRRLVFITGKGGVGKTTLAAALGYLAAKLGKKVLLCELEPRGNLPLVLGLKGTAYNPRQADDNLYVMSMDTGRALAEYAQITLKLPYFASIGPLGNIIELFSMAAPGVREILSVGKLCYEIHEGNYDLVIADASATGHIAGIMRASKNVHDLTATGVIRNQTSWMDDILYDPEQTSIAITATPQETPVTETLDLFSTLLSSLGNPSSLIFVNKVTAELFSKKEERLFYMLTDGKATSQHGGQFVSGKAAVSQQKTAGEEPLLENLFSIADLATQVRRSEEVHLTRLESGLKLISENKKYVSPETYYIPYLFFGKDLFAMTKQAARHLAEELSIELSS